MINIKLNLTNKLLNKYNKLYVEVATYYGLQDKIKKSTEGPRQGLYYILIEHFGYDSIFTNASPENVLNYLKVKYPYLSDFYKIFHYDDFNITEDDFYNINQSIKKIRNEMKSKK